MSFLPKKPLVIEYYILKRQVLVNMTLKADLQELMNKLRKLQGAIDFSSASPDERDELTSDLAKIMDELFELMKTLPE